MSYIRLLKNDYIDSKDSKKISIIIEIIAFVSIGFFILFGQFGHQFGFPLDDAWIHQTYARNLAENGRWSYTGESVSGGSTSPLWTMILSLGHLLKIGIPWTFILSAFIYILVVYFSTQIIIEIKPIQKKWTLLLAAFVIIFDWHLLWAAASGMETIIFILGVVILIYLLLQESPVWLFVGILNGVLVWIRPDGLTLLGPSMFILLLGFLQQKWSWKQFVKFVVPFLFLFTLFMVFNFSISGELFPTTFYAKQAEYQSLLKSPLSSRILNEFIQIVTGSGILLLPGFIYVLFQGIKKFDWKMLSIILWILGYIIIYSLRLPVTYQHGRYMMPVIVPFLLVGITGIFSIFEKINKEKIRKLIATGWMGTIVIITFVFYFLGLQIYRSDVIIINKLLVDPAKWIQLNLSESEIIATHDIGAIGYFTKNPIVDLAGLINPEIIPIINDETELVTYMKSKNVAYYFGFADWYKYSDRWGPIIKEYSEKYQGKIEKIVIIQLKDY